MWQTVVLIPKGDGVEFRGVGLVKVLWKTMTVILNLHFTSAICFHRFLHGFWEVRSAGTTALKSKLIQYITAMREAVLYEIFLNLHKYYDALDCYKCLEILVSYGLVPRALRLLWTYWGWITIVDKSRVYYEPLFKGFHGVTQGDPLSPTIFNVVVDSVMSH